MADATRGATAPISSAALAASPETSTTPSAPRDVVDELGSLRNELFNVHVLLQAILARVDQFEDESEIDCNVGDTLGRLLGLAAREVNRLACGEKA